MPQLLCRSMFPLLSLLWLLLLLLLLLDGCLLVPLLQVLLLFLALHAPILSSLSADNIATTVPDPSCAIAVTGLLLSVLMMLVDDGADDDDDDGDDNDDDNDVVGYVVSERLGKQFRFSD